MKPSDVQKVAVKRLLQHLTQYDDLTCDDAVMDVLRFVSMIYRAARQHEREDINKVANGN